MKFLLDQDVYAATVRFLRSLSHDLLTASETGQATATDSHLLQMARRRGRILVTRDRDFGSLVWVEGLATGVIYLRIHSSLRSVHEELAAVLARYDESRLRSSFVVVEEGRHRIRSLPTDPTR